MNAIGQPISRLDGPAKVIGQARYAADTRLENLAYAVLVSSTIPSGRITRLDTSAAESAQGVLKVLTHLNMPRLKPVASPPAGQGYMPLQEDRVQYDGQHIAVVVADTFERASHAASLVRVDYAREPASFINVRREANFLDRAALVAVQRTRDSAYEGGSFAENDTQTGDVESALSAAPVKIEWAYATPPRHHSTMEPSATVAEWRGDELIMHDATQWIWGVRLILAAALDMPPEKIRVMNSFLGGGFGAKGYVWPHQILAAVAAREVGRPVKLVLTRAQTFTSHGFATGSLQTVALGATRDGRLTAIRHESVTATSVFDQYVEYGAIGTRSLYACPAIATKHRVLPLNVITPTPTRAPHEGLGMFALESAMDELAHELKIDPVELRLGNYAETDPTSRKPFSSKKLRECYQLGAERFGWLRRSPEPQSQREGRDLLGLGMASALMSTFRFAANARVRMLRDGSVIVEAGCQEIGTGNHTVLPQIAADALGVPVERVRLHLGDTTLPETSGTFGSSSTMSVGSAVFDAGTKLKEKLAQLSGAGASASLTAEAYPALLARHNLPELSADGKWGPGPNAAPLGEVPEWSMHTFGAVFAEVRVDADFGLVRVTRILGVYSAGRIINPKTARSQMLGGLIWGLGQALLEHSETDSKLGRFVSKNFAGYLLPVNADVADIDAFFVEEYDPHASLIGARGIGELSFTGTSAAIANAVFNATGKRVRDLPILPEKFLI
jgi:xanthine dehydrogenase YagR molybdenum-binding subunit